MLRYELLAGPQEGQKVFCHCFWLFLLDPMAGVIDQVAPAEVAASGLLHFLKSARDLPNTPILSAGDEGGRHSHGAPGI